VSSRNKTSVIYNVFVILAIHVAADQRKLPARRNREGVWLEMTVTRVTCPCVALEDSIVGSLSAEIDKSDYFHSGVTIIDHCANEMSPCVLDNLSTLSRENFYK